MMVIIIVIITDNAHCILHLEISYLIQIPNQSKQMICLWRTQCYLQLAFTGA